MYNCPPGEPLTWKTQRYEERRDWIERKGSTI